MVDISALPEQAHGINMFSSSMNDVAGVGPLIVEANWTCS